MRGRDSLNIFRPKSPGIRILVGGGGESWSSYWSHQSEVLFFGLYSEISGGQMPNKVPGSSDYLTVVGSAGSETYQCPNTAPYIAADTDYIWFKTDESQRTVTTAELIGYDLQRTPVKYEDESPNEIVAIIILNAAVTGTKRDYLFRDMWLPVLWDNDLNGYGHIKDNRIGQQLWTPEAVATFIDTFTDTEDTALADHTPDSANFVWTNATYLFRIKSNMAQGVNSGAICQAYFDSNNTDPDISATLVIPDANNYSIALLIRRNSSTQHWRVRVNRAAGGDTSIGILNNTTVVTSITTTHSAGAGILRCVVSGNFFTVYWKGIKVIDNYETDGSWNTAEHHGLLSYFDATNTVVPIDNFQIV